MAPVDEDWGSVIFHKLHPINVTPAPSIPPWIIQVAENWTFDRPASSKSTHDQRAFKSDLMDYHSLTNQDNMIPCQLLGFPIPSRLAIAAHLFRKSKKDYLYPILGLDDVNSPRNGLVLFKCFEHEFDNYGICFIKENDVIKMKILNPELESMTFENHLNNTRKDLCSSLPNHLKFQTFGQYNNRPLLFNNPANLPFTRCLNYQARVAQAFAIKEGWTREGEFEFENFWSNEDLVNAEGIQNWLTQVSSIGTAGSSSSSA
jgi:hypothetical protein